MDGLLTRLREEMSDFNSCRSYQRLKNEKLKYLVIDPNIGTVGRAGEGNESLFYRFFARLSADEKSIQTHGALTMLMKMAQEGYIKLIYTNNLGAKYAFELSDEELKTIFGVESKEDILLLRSKMAVAKFFYQDQTFIEKLFTLFQTRMLSGEGIGDIANIMGKKVDEKKLFAVFENILKRNPQGLDQLSQEEKMVFAQYFALFRLMVAPSSEMKNQAQLALSKVFQSSLFGSSQIITLELK